MTVPTVVFPRHESLSRSESLSLNLPQPTRLRPGVGGQKSKGLLKAQRTQEASQEVDPLPGPGVPGSIILHRP